MRKLLMLGASALAALAFAGVSASSASALSPLFFTDWGWQFCPAVSSVDGEVSGGCVIEDFEGSIELYANVPNPVTIGDYAVTFDLVVDGAGNGYAVDPTFGSMSGAPVRKACDETDGSPLPWPVQSSMPSVGEYEMDITFGVTLGTAQPGGPCSQQQITVDAEFYPSDTELDQVGASANLRDGNWDSDDWQHVDYE
jgi:hypothetical protein